jgi:hypothetical protein
MEPKQKPTPHTTRDDDVDLGHFFYQTGGAITNFFNWLGRVFTSLGHALLLFLFFVKRNFLWLLAGLLLGIVYGLFVTSKSGNSYYSEMTVKTNFSSSRALYGTLQYFNALISNRQTAEVSKTFSLTAAEASSIIYFEAEPVVSEVITADMYKEKFLNLYHNTQVRMDTFWVKTISYREFKNSLTNFDYPLHKIKVTSYNPYIFPKIQQGLVKYISANETLKSIKANGEQLNAEEINLLESSIRSLDTLRNAYTRRLAAGITSGEKGNNITMLEGDMVMNPPELELYNKVLQLKDELKMVKNQAVLERNILEIYSPFSSVGRKEGFLKQKITQFGLLGLLIAFIITAFIGLYKTLTRLENVYRKEKSLKTGT